MSEYNKIIEQLQQVHTIAKELELQAEQQANSIRSWLQTSLNEFEERITVRYQQLIPSRGQKRSVISTILEEDISAVIECNIDNKRFCDESSEIKGGRPRRTASKIAEQNINKQINLNLHMKMRRPSTDATNGVHIKQEKLSIVSGNVEDVMLPPPPPPLTVLKRRGRRRKEESHSNKIDGFTFVIKEEKVADPDKDVARNGDRFDLNSDVIEIPAYNHERVSLSDSDDNDTNSGHSKTQGNKESFAEKSMREESEKEILMSLTKKKNSTKEIAVESSVYEDAVQEQANYKSITQSCFVDLSGMNNIISNQFNTTYAVNNESNSNGSPFASNDRQTKTYESEVKKIADETITICKHSSSDSERNGPLMTDDDSDQEEIPTSNRANAELLFSPYNNVKKRVEALEKLASSSADESPKLKSVVCRVTRTKTRAMAAAAEADSKNKAMKEVEKPLYTAAALRRLLPTASGVPSETAIKTGTTPRLNIVTTMDSFIPKPNSTLKQSRLDPRDKHEEEQRRKFEREQEVQRKKNAILSAKVEERRKKRLDKAEKVQIARAALERERRVQMEKIEREKEEKQKQLQAERERELLRKKELAEKRAREHEERRKAEEHARQRILEQKELEKLTETQRRKEQEECDRLHQKRMQEEAEQVRAKARAQKLANAKAKHLKNKKPFTPMTPLATPNTQSNTTELNFNTDDSSDEEQKNIPKKPWAQAEMTRRRAEIQKSVPNGIVDALFSSSVTVINLREVFPSIDERLLRRNSSAIWRTPPRYSQIRKD